MADVLRCDAALEETVAHFISSRHVRKPDGEIGFAIMGEVQFLTFWLCQGGIYTSFLQVTEQCRMGKFFHFQMLETRFGCLLVKRERYRSDVWHLLRYLTKQIGNIVRTVKFLRQCDDVAASAQPVIEPQIVFHTHLKRCFCFLPERGFVPKVVSLLLHGRVAQTLQIVRQFDCFCFLNVHNVYSYGFDDG